MDFQTIAAILFIAFLTFFLFKNKKKIQTQGYFPVIYFLMYRTKLGLKLMEKLSKKIPRILKWLAFAGVFIGFLGMIVISYNLIVNVFQLIFAPSAPAGVALVLPFKVKGSFYVPFFYWIISIFILAVVHEFSHGVIARLYDIKIKSSGFAFLGIIVPVVPAAFVEQDEKQMNDKSTSAKLSVFAAGPFSNILTAAIVALIFMLVFSPLTSAIFTPNGITVSGYVKDGENTTFPAQEAGIKKGEVILKINDVDVSSLENFTAELEDKKPGEEIKITTNVSEYTIELDENPEDANKSYLGIFVKQNTKVDHDFEERYGSIMTSVLVWLIGLFYWLYVLNLGIGLFNLVPIGPLDGGKMLYAVLEKYLRKDIAFKIWKLVSSVFLFAILIIILFTFIK